MDTKSFYVIYYISTTRLHSVTLNFDPFTKQTGEPVLKNEFRVLGEANKPVLCVTDKWSIFKRWRKFCIRPQEQTL